jgi:transposase
MTPKQYEKELRDRDRIIRQQAKEIEELKRRIAQLEKKLNQRELKTPPEPDASDPPLDYSLATQQRRKKRKRKKRSPGRRRKQDKLTLVGRTEDVYPEGVVPEKCCFLRDRFAWRLEDGKAILVRYRIYKEKWTNTAGRVLDLMPRGEFGIEVAVVLAFLVYVLGISTDKARALLSFFCGLPLSRSEADSLLSQLGRLWTPEFETLCELIALSMVVYMDETGWKVGRRKCATWVFTTALHTVLLYGRKKDHTVLDEMLPEATFQGIGVSDDHALYRERFDRGQKCWAHLLRKIIALMLTHPEKPAYRKFFERLLAIFQEAKRCQKDGRLGAAGRAKKVQWLERKIRRLCTRWQETLDENTAEDVRKFVNLQKELRRLVEHQKLFTFVEHPEVEATNNRSERTFRHAAQARDTSQTSKTDQGAKRRSVIASVLFSLRQNLGEFSLGSVVAEAVRWMRSGVSLFQRQLNDLQGRLDEDEIPCLDSS